MVQAQVDHRAVYGYGHLLVTAALSQSCRQSVTQRFPFLGGERSQQGTDSRHLPARM
jgi:hypothetical protein